LLLRRIEQPLPKRWLPVLTWGGLRGALALAIVLSVPVALVSADLEEELVAMTFGGDSFLAAGQGLTIYPLLRHLGLSTGESEAQLEYENNYALLLTTAATRRQLANREEQ
jgi:monovalent cation:H+ antiporter, CPA1 family